MQNRRCGGVKEGGEAPRDSKVVLLRGSGHERGRNRPQQVVDLGRCAEPQEQEGGLSGALRRVLAERGDGVQVLLRLRVVLRQPGLAPCVVAIRGAEDAQAVSGGKEGVAGASNLVAARQRSALRCRSEAPATAPVPEIRQRRGAPHLRATRLDYLDVLTATGAVVFLGT